MAQSYGMDKFVQNYFTANKVQGRGGPLTAFISEAGGTGGAALGAQIGAMAGSVVPFAGTLLGSAIGAGIGGLAGSFGGKALEQQIRDEQALFGTGGSFKKAAQEGLLTGALSGLGTAVSGVRAAGKAGISAKEALKMSPQVIQEAKAVAQATKESYKALTGSQRMLADSYNLLPGTQAKGKTLSTAKSKELLDHISSITNSTNPEQILADTESHISQVGKQIGTQVTNQNRALTAAEKKLLKDGVKSAAQDVAGLSADNPTVKQFIKDISAAKDLNGVQAIRQSVQKQLSFSSAAKNSALEQYRENVRKLAVDFIDKNVEGLKPLNQAYNLSKDALPFLRANLSRNIGVRLPIGVGATQLTLGGRGPVAAKIAGAKLAERVGGAVAPLSQLAQAVPSAVRVPLQVQATKGLLGVVGGLGGGQQAAQTVAPTADMTGATTGITQQPAAFDPRVLQVRDAIIQDYQKTGGKNVKNIQTIAGLYGIDLSPIGLGTTATSKIDTTTKRQLAAISTAGTILSQLQSAFDAAGGAQGRVAGYGQIALGRIGAANKVQAYQNLRSGYMSRIARALGEVGVLNEGDIQRALKLIPNVTATPEEAAIQFESLRQLLKDSYNTMQTQAQ